MSVFSQQSTAGQHCSLSLRTTDRFFRYASPSLWNQLPSSLRQHHFSPSVSVLPVHVPTTSSHSVNSPLSPSITPSLFHSWLKTYLFHKSFPTINSLPVSGLTPRIPWTVPSVSSVSFVFSFFITFLFGSVRQIKLALRQLLALVNIVSYCVVSILL